MLSKKHTPFDRDRDEKPLIKMLVHTDSFVGEIMSNEKVITSLLKLSTFPFLQIVVMPTKDSRIIDSLQKMSIKIWTYKFHEDVISLNTEGFSKYFPMGKYENLEDPIIDGSSINKLDFFVGRNKDFDYFVTNIGDPYFSSNLKENRDICPEYAIELIRILLVNLGHFYLTPKRRVNEGYYYLYRSMKLFYEFQIAWSVVVNIHGKGIAEEVFNQFGSLSTRLDLLCRSADKTIYYALKWPNNDTQSNTLYHFGYLIMLITGVFDDLAWIIDELYSFKLRREDVSIRIPKKKVSKFYNLLATVNKDLYDYLTDKNTQEKIFLFYPIRDSLQHRQFIKGVHYSNKSNNCEKNIFRISSEAGDAIKNLSLYNGKEYGLDLLLEEQFYIDAYIFTLKALEIIYEIVNSTMRLIDWDIYTRVLADDERNSLYTSIKGFQSGLGKWLGWGIEPLYF